MARGSIPDEVSAISLALLMASAQWTLWDFGSKQICYNSITGEHKVVFGEGAVFPDGPFRHIVAHPDSEDVAVLLGDGPVDACAMHTMDECGAQTPAPQLRGGVEDWPVPRGGASEAGASTQWTSDLQHTYATLPLELAGVPPARLDFHRFDVPTMLGAKPVRLWVGFGRLADFVLRPLDTQTSRGYRDHRIFQAVLQTCKKLGVHEDNFRISSRASRKRVAPDGDEDGEEPEGAGTVLDGPQADEDWLMSFPAVLTWLWECVEKGRVTCSQDAALQRAQRVRAKALLHRLLGWPFGGGDEPATMAVRTPYGDFWTVLHGGIVDKAELLLAEGGVEAADPRVRDPRSSGGHPPARGGQAGGGEGGRR